MGPIAGIAAGLGLAALASHLGLGEEFGTILLMALVFFVVLIAVRMFMARRNGGAIGRGPRSAYAGAGSGGDSGGMRSACPKQPAVGCPHRGFRCRPGAAEGRFCRAASAEARRGHGERGHVLATFRPISMPTASSMAPRSTSSGCRPPSTTTVPTTCANSPRRRCLPS